MSIFGLSKKPGESSGTSTEQASANDYREELFGAHPVRELGITKSTRHEMGLIQYLNGNGQKSLSRAIDSMRHHGMIGIYLDDHRNPSKERRNIRKWLQEAGYTDVKHVYRARSPDLARDLHERMELKPQEKLTPELQEKMIGLQVYTGNDLVYNFAYDYHVFGLNGKVGESPSPTELLLRREPGEIFYLESPDVITTPDEYRRIIRMQVLEQKGIPKLCLLGPNNRDLESIVHEAAKREDGKLLVAAERDRYDRLADAYMRMLLGNGNGNGGNGNGGGKYKIIPREGYKIIPREGTIEELPMRGDADLVVTIVDSGRTAEENGLRIYEEIGPAYLVVARARFL